MLLFNQKNSHKGGALVVVLLVLTLFSLLAVYMTINTSTSLDSSRSALCQNAADSIIQSCENHISAFLYNDLSVNGYDSFSDEWYIQNQNTSSNKFSQWFYFPGPIGGTLSRYRFYVEDIKPSKKYPNDYQPLAPVAWSGGKWISTDDINAISKDNLKKLIKCFDSSSTNELKLKKITAMLIDDRDANNYLSDIDIPDTEAITFDIIADTSDTRWIHFDDSMRLGRYYEQRSSHNFFLIKDARFFYNNDTGKTNVEIRLDDAPMSHLPGWDKYSRMRFEAGLPMWHPGMWNNIVAITGAGKNLERQNVISNTIETLIFEDNNYNRFMPTGTFRQTVTFVGWFSSLNEMQTFKTRSAKNRGAIFTLTNSAPDGILITNVSSESNYRMTLYSGSRLPEELKASASFFGMEALQEIEFSKNGVAVFNKGKPATSHAYKKGNYLELIIRSPEKGVSKYNPFFIDSAILEQPEFITLYNSSDSSINIRNWRLSYRCGDLLFPSMPFKTSVYYSVRHSDRIKNSSPVIPPNSSLILTSDLSLFDRFSGANKNGIWGDNAGENIPAIQIEKSSWGPEFKIKSIKSLKTYSQKSTSNKNHPWETDWEIEIEGVNWSDEISNLKNEVVLFDADGDDEKYSPVPGIIVDQKKSSLVVRMAGSGKRFSNTLEAELKFTGLSDIISEYYLLDSAGKVAAIIRKPQKVNREPGSSMFKKLISGKVEVNKINWGTVTRQIKNSKNSHRKIRNSKYDSPIEKAAVLDKLKINISNDWYLCNSRFMNFSDAHSIPSSKIRVIKDVIKIKRFEGSRFIFDDDSHEYPLGPPGIYSDKLYIKGTSPLSIHSFSESSCKILIPNIFTATQTVNKSAVISPDGTSGGMHVFGPSGSIIFEWTNLPKVSSSVKLTLSGCGTRGIYIPSSIFERNILTNKSLELTIGIWDEKKIKFIPLVKKKTFDVSGRLYLGEIPEKNLKSGRLRLRVTTHNVLSKDQGELWLHGIYLHPFTENKYVNINTVPKNKFLYICKNKTNLAVVLSKIISSGKYFKTAGELYRIIKKNRLPIIGAENFIVRSDIFRAEIEAETISEKTKEIISRKVDERIINRRRNR